MSKAATYITLVISFFVLFLGAGFELLRLYKGNQNIKDSYNKNLHEIRIYNYERMFDSESSKLRIEELDFNIENGANEKLEQTSSKNFSHNTCAWFIYGPIDGRISGALTLLHYTC